MMNSPKTVTTESWGGAGLSTQALTVTTGLGGSVGRVAGVGAGGAGVVAGVKVGVKPGVSVGSGVQAGVLVGVGAPNRCSQAMPSSSLSRSCISPRSTDLQYS